MYCIQIYAAMSECIPQYIYIFLGLCIEYLPWWEQVNSGLRLLSDITHWPAYIQQMVLISPGTITICKLYASKWHKSAKIIYLIVLHCFEHYIFYYDLQIYK